MEAPNDDLASWPSLDSDVFDGSFAKWPTSDFSNGSSREPLPLEPSTDGYISAQDRGPDPNLILRNLGIDLSISSPIELIDNFDLPETPSAGLADASSPAIPNHMTWSPSSVESGSTNSPTTPETLGLSPGLSPDLLSLSSPAPHINFVHGSSIGWSQLPMEQGVIGDVGQGILQGADLISEVESSSSRLSTVHKPHNRHSLPARERRKLDRPEECPLCGKGHAYRAGLNRHICSKHPDEAARFNLSTERQVCKWCRSSFARKDHLLRHLTRKHQRAKQQHRRKRGDIPEMCVTR
ncbi:hypothetical protein N656DRAFT_358501 [Canariomyces notabilis]|uniref:C2H2-type domain-containing protein n=1 Tax=Canariomyces notabilis TaxID=2074819 RepID=A0AAN6QHZ8_9PEZI|nr:hypothetical protein N656DRAFT_358501 [Canariomyces arenarius]